MNRVDVHILTMNEPLSWREQCISSLEGADINLSVQPGIMKGMGEARARGFEIGSAKYVSYADPDDIYVPEVFGKLADLLDKDSSLSYAYSAQSMVLEDGTPTNVAFFSGTEMHPAGVFVMRRDLVLGALPIIRPLSNFTEWVISSLLAEKGGVAFLPEVGRKHRIHPGQSHEVNDPAAMAILKESFQRRYLTKKASGSND